MSRSFFRNIDEVMMVQGPVFIKHMTLNHQTIIVKGKFATR